MMKNNVCVRRSFNVVGMILLFMGSFSCMQASSRPSSENSNQDNNELIQIGGVQAQNFLSQPKQQAVFYAIRKGLDYAICSELLNVSIKNSPSDQFSRLMMHEVDRVYKTDSPIVRNLKYRINGQDGTRAAEREQLREQLEDIQNS